MENKKSNKGLVVLNVILILIVLVLCGFIAYDKFIKKDTCKCTKCDVKETKNEDTKVSKKDASKGIVYDDGTNQYKRVPIINIDSTDANKLNKEINDYVDKMSSETDYGEAYALTYDYFENNDVLSIKMTITTIGSSRYYKTVNINSNTGKEVSNYDLIKSKSIDENEIGNAIFDIYTKEAEKNGSLDVYKTQHIYGDEYTSVYDGTKNLVTNKKYDDFDMYLNSKGELCVISDVYLIAGPEMNFYVFNLNSYSYEK